MIEQSILFKKTPYLIQGTPQIVFQAESENIFFSDDGLLAAEKIIQNLQEYMRITDVLTQNIIMCIPLQNIGFTKINYKFIFTIDNKFVILIRSYQNKSFIMIQNLIENYNKEFNFELCQFIQFWNNNFNIYLILSNYSTKCIQLYHIDQHMNVNLEFQHPKWEHLSKMIHIDTLTQFNPCFLLANTQEIRLFCKYRLKGQRSIFVREINHVKVYASKILMLKPSYDSLQTHFYYLTCNKLIRKITTQDYRNSLFQGRFIYLCNFNTINIYNFENGKLMIQMNILERIENLRILRGFLVYKNGLLYKGWGNKQNESQQDILKVQQ